MTVYVAHAPCGHAPLLTMAPWFHWMFFQLMLRAVMSERVCVCTITDHCMLLACQWLPGQHTKAAVLSATFISEAVCCHSTLRQNRNDA